LLQTGCVSLVCRCSVLSLRRQGQWPSACAPFVASAPPRRSSATAVVGETPKRPAFLGFSSPSTLMRGGFYRPRFPTRVQPIDPARNRCRHRPRPWDPSTSRIRRKPCGFRYLFAPCLPCLPGIFQPGGVLGVLPYKGLTILAPAPPSSTLPSSVCLPFFSLAVAQLSIRQANRGLLWGFKPTANGMPDSCRSRAFSYKQFPASRFLRGRTQAASQAAGSLIDRIPSRVCHRSTSSQLPHGSQAGAFAGLTGVAAPSGGRCSWCGSPALRRAPAPGRLLWKSLRISEFASPAESLSEFTPLRMCIRQAGIQGF